MSVGVRHEKFDSLRWLGMVAIAGEGRRSDHDGSAAAIDTAFLLHAVLFGGVKHRVDKLSGQD